jgi:hypothetical protein
MAPLGNDLVFAMIFATQLSLCPVLWIKFSFEISISAPFVLETNFTADIFLMFSVFYPHTVLLKIQKNYFHGLFCFFLYYSRINVLLIALFD